MQHSTDQVMINGWNLKLCHHSVIGSAYLISYWGNAEPDILCHSVGPRLHDCARTLLAHPLQSYDRLGIGPHLFPLTVTARNQDVTPCQDFSIVCTSVKSGNNKPGNFRTFSTSKQQETPTSYTNQCFHICTHLQTQGNSVFPTWDLPPGGHWAFDLFHTS